tara:strand:- start:382 stop:555 length:174 start_codon:yes stop_codon:yes gene_type:complete
MISTREYVINWRAGATKASFFEPFFLDLLFFISSLRTLINQRGVGPAIKVVVQRFFM